MTTRIYTLISSKQIITEKRTMKRLFAYIFLAAGVVTTYADNWVKDAEPAILEVRYNRIEVTDTLHRESLFFKDEMILRIGKTKSLF